MLPKIVRAVSALARQSRYSAFDFAQPNCGSGAQGRNRTTDTAIFNRMLYQLSYLGAENPPDDGRVKRGGYRG